jgi:SAM-dependent methyltransferase
MSESEVASFDRADRELAEVLEDLEGADRYRAWILSCIESHVRGDVLEVGAGLGTYTAGLSSMSMSRSVTAVEPSSSAAAKLRSSVAGLAGVRIVEGTLASVPPGEHDCAVLINVLEHIEDDAAALDEIHAALRPGGSLCIWVPAFMGLYSGFDRDIGHYRRYRRPALMSLVERHGFSVERSTYANLPGFFAWWILVRVLGRKPTSGGAARLYDRWVVPVAAAVERRIPPPFGQSILVLARRVDGALG